MTSRAHRSVVAIFSIFMHVVPDSATLCSGEVSMSSLVLCVVRVHACMLTEPGSLPDAGC